MPRILNVKYAPTPESVRLPDGLLFELAQNIEVFFLQLRGDIFFFEFFDTAVFEDFVAFAEIESAQGGDEQIRRVPPLMLFFGDFPQIISVFRAFPEFNLDDKDILVLFVLREF